MIKIPNFCGIFATLFVTTTMVLLASCSQDDDNYDSDMYTLAEMGTRLGGGDPGSGGTGGGNTPFIYPTIDEIMSNTVVIQQAESAWNQMMADSTNHEYHERGFYIYYNRLTGEYYCGEIQMGSTSSISFSAPHDSAICASYHCHTPSTYYPSTLCRNTGPSEGDLSMARTYKLPGLVEDYSVNPLYGGAPANASHHIRSFGPSRRTYIY